MSRSGFLRTNLFSLAQTLNIQKSHRRSTYSAMAYIHCYLQFFYPNFTLVIVSEPPNGLSLKMVVLSLLFFKAKVYSKGR